MGVTKIPEDALQINLVFQGVFLVPLLTHSKTTTISEVNWSRRDWSLKCTPNFFQTRTTGPFHWNLSELGSPLWITEKARPPNGWTSSSNWRPAKRCKTAAIGVRNIFTEKRVFFWRKDVNVNLSKSEVEAMRTFLWSWIMALYGHLSYCTSIKATVPHSPTRNRGVIFFGL